MRLIAGTVGLAALWLLMSGIYDKPLILIFGVISVLLSIWIAMRMDKADGEQLRYTLSVLGTIRYTFWLFKEIAKSNWAVASLILSGREPSRQKLFMVTATQKSDMAQVVFANSITLTPATITVETENEQLVVHALDFAEGDQEALEDMDARVTAIERGGEL